MLSSGKTSYLYKQLRPELVKIHTVPLSSDAFSPFGKLDQEIHNKEVEDAFKVLMYLVLARIYIDTEL